MCEFRWCSKSSYKRETSNKQITPKRQQKEGQGHNVCGTSSLVITKPHVKTERLMTVCTVTTKKEQLFITFVRLRCRLKILPLPGKPINLGRKTLMGSNGLFSRLKTKETNVRRWLDKAPQGAWTSRVNPAPRTDLHTHTHPVSRAASVQGGCSLLCHATGLADERASVLVPRLLLRSQLQHNYECKRKKSNQGNSSENQKGPIPMWKDIWSIIQRNAEGKKIPFFTHQIRGKPC